MHNPARLLLISQNHAPADLLMMEKIHDADSKDMFRPPKLPFELFDLIAQDVIRKAAEEGDANTMKTCSLVLSDWRIPFQRALFKIKVPYLQFSEYATQEEKNIIYDLRNLLDSNPNFQQVITSLRLRILGSGTLPGSTADFTPSLLSQLTSVATLRISQVQPGGRRHSWTSLTGEAQAGVSALLRSPSLRHLDIPWFDAPLAITFQEGVEIHAVSITSDRFPHQVQSDYYLLDGSDPNWDSAADPSIRPCVIRHLKSVPRLASKILRATRTTRTGARMPIIVSSAMDSLDITMQEHGELQDLRAVLHRTSNLQKLIVFGACMLCAKHMVADYLSGGGMDRLFEEPQPKCLESLEDIDLAFSLLNKPEELIKVIISEFSLYPPENVLKRITMKIPSFKHVYDLSLAERLQDDLVALGDLLCNTYRFPFLEHVEVIPGYGLKWERNWELGASDSVRYFSKILEEVRMGLEKMGLGSKFAIGDVRRMVGLWKERV